MVSQMVSSVSIVITNYNYAQFVGRCIESALAQTYPRVQVVVVDDASRDNSREVILRYADRVKTVFLEVNGGQAAAFNAGFNASTGDIVFFLDADDWLYPHAVARVVEAVADGVALVQFRLHLVDGAERQIDLLPPAEVAFDEGDVVPHLLARGRFECTVTSGNAFLRTTLAAVLPVPEDSFRISADGYLVTVAPFCGRVVALDEPLGAYAVHGNNNWTGAFGRVADASRFRRALDHDERRYEALKRRAALRGLRVTAQPGLADTQHLTSRLGSALLEPEKHPYPGDRRLHLGLCGAAASRNSKLPRHMAVVLAGWFLALGTLPRPWAATLLRWRLDPVSRPERLSRAIAALRRRPLRREKSA